MKVYFLNDGHNNAGDMLSQPILEHFGVNFEPCGRKIRGKMLAVGSVMSALRANDVVWGTGCIRDKIIESPPGARFLSVRGPRTRSLIAGGDVPGVYGDLALLLPLVYDPTVEKKYKVGVVPHYIDKDIVEQKDGQHWIDIQADWHKVVEEIKSCEMIISSSLHGIVIAEAYGIPATWVRYSNRIIGGDFKFQDYFLGTGRPEQRKGWLIPPIDGLEERKNKLISVLKNHYGI